jgi:AcrR family transcriptional regulator
MATRRQVRWGTDAPVDDDQARERLLDAAETCYRSIGIGRTRMDDIAAAASVHRTTVYNYFPNKDAVLAAAFTREVDAILKGTERHLRGDQPFAERLINACVESLRDARNSQYMGVLLDAASAGQTLHAAAASEVFTQRATAALEPSLREAVDKGEARRDVPPDTMLRWIFRIALSLAGEPAIPVDGGDEGVLRAFLLPAILR